MIGWAAIGGKIAAGMLFLVLVAGFWKIRALQGGLEQAQADAATWQRRAVSAEAVSTMLVSAMRVASDIEMGREKLRAEEAARQTQIRKTLREAEHNAEFRAWRDAALPDVLLLGRGVFGSRSAGAISRDADASGGSVAPVPGTGVGGAD